MSGVDSPLLRSCLSVQLQRLTSLHATCRSCRVDHDVKGQAIYAFVTVAEGAPHSDALRRQLANNVRNMIGAFAVPDTIHWAPSLPKTRSGEGQQCHGTAHEAAALDVYLIYGC